MSTETTARHRPTRLRNACLGCTSAKVKCSGDKTGCARCTKNGIECVFLESMAGRVPRAPRKQSWVSFDGTQTSKSQQKKNGHNDGDGVTGFSPHAEATGATMSRPPSRMMTDSIPMTDDDYVITPTPEPFQPDASTPISTAQPLMHSFPVSYPAGEMWPYPVASDCDFASIFSTHDGYMTDQDANMLESLIHQFPSTNHSMDDQNSSPPGTTSSSNGSTPPPTRHGDLADYRQLDKPCVIAATQIITVLENTIDSPSQSLDLVLEIVRKAGVGLNALIGLQEQSRQQRCLALFGAIMHQILEHLATQVRRLEIDSNSTVTGPSNAPPSAHNATLHQLDSINVLISSYQGDARPASGNVARARMLLAEIESSLQTAFRAMELADRAGESAKSASSWNGRSARSDFENIQIQLGLLRKRLYDAVVKMVASEDSRIKFTS